MRSREGAAVDRGGGCDCGCCCWSKSASALAWEEHARTPTHPLCSPPPPPYPNRLPGLKLGTGDASGGKWSETAGSFRVMWREGGNAVAYIYYQARGFVGSACVGGARGARERTFLTPPAPLAPTLHPCITPTPCLPHHAPWRRWLAATWTRPTRTPALRTLLISPRGGATCGAGAMTSCALSLTCGPTWSCTSSSTPRASTTACARCEKGRGTGLGCC